MLLTKYIIGTNLLTKFHKDRKINEASRVLTRKNALPAGSHVLQPTGIIFEHVQDIIGINLLTKFHEDRTVNVASRVLTRFYYRHIQKNAPPLGSHANFLTKFHEDWKINEQCPAPDGHVFKATKTMFELIQDIIRTNLLTKFHDDRIINVTSRVLTRKNAPPPWWPSFIGINLLTKFHEDPTINVASRVKNASPLGSHIFQAKVTIFKLIQDIIGTNLLTKFHEDPKINVASRVLKRKNAPPPGGHVFQPTGIIFELVQDIIGMNLLTKFHEDLTINVASRVLTRFYYSHIRKNAPPFGSHIFQAKVTIFELIQYIIGTNLLTKVLTRKNAPPPGGHVFQPTGIIFEFVQDIIGMNLLTKFHEDQSINVASRVLTRFYYSHIRKNALPFGSHVFQANETIFELIKNIIGTNLLTKFHEDWTINVVSRKLTRQMLTPHNGQKAITKAHPEHVVLR
ncbi:hypothetical protein DPMN_000075 [Dreissena polymorpha]|uniref:Uncharacterized protein n=1 Tax=Dreissena polymorpha TaxID=45954 RepID=A0A9D4RRC9_DREPO|nr:hypothetical protein DPMN_000075 [Dreissena polymorpha]